MTKKQTTTPKTDRPVKTHKTLYVPAESVEVWDAAAERAAARGVSLSTYVSDALAEYNRRNGSTESPASLAKRLSDILNRS